MKYNDVVLIINSGVLNATSHTISINSAYAVTKFKREIERLFKDWQGKNEALVKEAGIENGEAFDKRRAELTTKLQGGKLNNAEAKELDKLNEQIIRLQGLRAKLADEEVSISVDPMPFEDWHSLKNENKELKFRDVESLELAESTLENILWVAPK